MDVILNLTGKRKILWDAEEETPSSVPAPVQTEETASTTQPPSGSQCITVGTNQIVTHQVKKIKSGNGHKSEMIRKLLNSERDAIRSEFIKINGCTAEDHWVAFRKENEAIGLEVSINQVTGFVSYLHRDVWAGGITANQLPDLLFYLKWLQGQFKLWAQYDSSKYEIYRQKNKNEKLEKAMAALMLEQSGQTAGPKFASGFPAKHKYA